MQISSANLLAAQAQPARPRQTGAAFEPAFEPMAFKTAAAPVKTADAAKPVAAGPSPGAALLSGSEPATGGATGDVRPGTNLDIKI